MTTRERQASQAFQRFTETDENRTIFKAYKTPSNVKVRVWNRIVNDYLKLTEKNDNDFQFMLRARPRVISKNDCFFTAGFMYVNDEGFICFRYYAPTWSYDIQIEG